MERSEALERALRAFRRYYDVQSEEIEEPFQAEAVFHSHEKQYFLVKSARISETESNEYIYFAAPEVLTEEKLYELDQAAWQRGTAQVEPHPEHKNSDVVLFIITDRISEEAAPCIRKMKHYQSYRHSLWGWSHYSLIVYELSTGNIAYNRYGHALKKLVGKIYH